MEKTEKPCESTHTHTHGILTKNKKKNVIFADCQKEELKLLKKGIEDSVGTEFEIKNSVCNGKHKGIKNIIRYLKYIFYPIKIFFKRKNYDIIICWQQFFGIFFAFYCKLFKVKKENTLVICNFVYKEKNGLLKNIYKNVMKYSINNYIDYINVNSYNYAEKVSKYFNIPMEKFIIIPFGLDDYYDKYKNSEVEYNNYSLSIGRSNRDYDFLIKVWKKMPKDEKLLIICDEYKEKEKLSENIIIRNDIFTDMPYIINSKIVIIPIEDGKVSSGDTVLLKSMLSYKTVIITEPSILAETYIENNVNGMCIPKKEETFRKSLLNIIHDQDKQIEIGKNARKCYEENYSRYNMGKKIGENIIDEKRFNLNNNTSI